MRKVIITGTKGFIGSNLKKRLEWDYEVIEINEDIFDNPNWRDEIESIIKKSEAHVFYHIGACSDTLNQDVNYMMKLNFQFTKILVDWSSDNDCKLIYSSSAANYVQNEKYPSNLYGWSKYVAEQYVVANGGIGLRYFNVYGPYETNKGVMASVAYQMLQKQKNGQEIKLFPKEPRRDFVYVGDVAQANIMAMKSKVDHAFFNIAFYVSFFPKNRALMASKRAAKI